MKGAFYWSVRRELWEHRSVWLAPLAVAAFVIFAVLVAGTGHIETGGSFARLPAEKQQAIVAMPFSLSAAVILVAAFVVGALACLESLNTERRDRSILFWKSMPVSDRTTVLSKLFVPLVVTPAVALAVALATQAILLVAVTAILKAKEVDTGILYAMPISSMTAVMIYGVIVHSLWFAPIYALFLMVSVLARRPLLWVILPTIVVQVLERIAFGTAYSGAFIKYRLMGAMSEAFTAGAMKGPITALSQLDPARFLASPGLWLGLAAAAAFVYAAIRLRRSREPLS
jgi:ABC-2 type transport system permease protein